MKSKKDNNLYKTLSVIVTGFAVVSLLLSAKWSLLVAILIGVFGLLSKKLLEIIVFVWDKISFVLSKIVPNILLAFVFYVFLTPIAILSRIFGKSDPLMLKNKSNSLFIDYTKKLTKSEFEKPW